MEAWNRLVERYGLLSKPFEDKAKVFGITDSALLGGWPLSVSVRKARGMGFHGTVDSFESAFDCLGGLARMRVVPPMVRERFEEGLPVRHC